MRGLSSDSAGAPPAQAPLSVILITRNEESNIRDCLASVAFAREIVVVDSGSTDATVALARQAGARVLVTPDWPGFGAQKNRALELATQPWVFSLDADERVTPHLRDEILAVLARGQDLPEAWSVPRRSSFCGQYMAHSGWYPDRVTRLFRRGAARFSDDLVHERLVTRGGPGKLQGDLLHGTYPDLESMLEKLNRYSSAWAESMFRKGERSSLAGAMLRGGWAFFRTYILRSGWRDGRMGLVLAVSIAEGTYYKYLKLWLLGRDPSGQEL
jgi:glycosyltransferase involved in cell wall biosynthesis